MVVVVVMVVVVMVGTLSSGGICIYLSSETQPELL